MPSSWAPSSPTRSTSAPRWASPREAAAADSRRAAATRLLSARELISRCHRCGSTCLATLRSRTSKSGVTDGAVVGKERHTSPTRTRSFIPVSYRVHVPSLASLACERSHVDPAQGSTVGVKERAYYPSRPSRAPTKIFPGAALRPPAGGVVASALGRLAWSCSCVRESAWL